MSTQDPQEQFAPGTLFGAGRFAIERILGRGGMGVVCLATDEMLNKQVALKFLSPAIQHNPTALEIMRSETRKSLELTHPNIIRIYDFHHFAGELPFISMEYVEGITMSYLKSQQPDRLFAWEMIEPLMPQLCAALQYAHGEGIIHRDLKPANMMLDQRQRMKLADFGLSVNTADTTDDHVDMGSSGTPSYMSPQQLVGAPSKPTDDIYALGASLYELLTSKPPFYEGDVPQQVRESTPQRLEDRLRDLGLTNSIPSHVSMLIMLCLAKDPDLRPQSMADVAEQLQVSFSEIVPDRKSEPPSARSIAGEGTKPRGYRGKSALGPVLAFGFVAISLAVIINKRSQPDEATNTEPNTASPPKVAESAFPRSDKAFTLMEPTGMFAGSSEILLFKDLGKTGSGSATGFDKRRVGTANAHWLCNARRVFASLKTPQRAGREAHSFLFLKQLVAKDFDLGLVWRSATAAAPVPRIYYRATDLNPASLEMADLPLDAMMFDPSQFRSSYFQGVVHPYRMLKPVPTSVTPFEAGQWSGETGRIGDLILKLSTSAAVRAGGSWAIIQARGDRIRYILNGQNVATLSLTQAAAGLNSDSAKALILRQATQSGAIAIEVRANPESGDVKFELGPFYYRSLD
jgi:serine/threonine protein kinase